MGDILKNCRLAGPAIALGMLITATTLLAQEVWFKATIEHSTDDARTWNAVEISGDDLAPDGRIWLKQQPPSTGGFYRVELSMDRMIDLNAMVLIGGGTLPPYSSLGSLTVTSFYLGQYEMNWAKWLEVRNWAVTNGYDIAGAGSGCQPNHPVQDMDWVEAIKWCNARSEMEGYPPVYFNDPAFSSVLRTTSVAPSNVTVHPKFSATGYRLPTEAEWEYAARGGTNTQGTLYAGSATLDEVGWYRDNSLSPTCLMLDDRGTFRLGLKLGNELHLHDMSGNVNEWIWDQHVIFSGGYMTNRRVRSGSWFGQESVSRLTTRLSIAPDYHDTTIGLRVARTHQPPTGPGGGSGI